MPIRNWHSIRLRDPDDFEWLRSKKPRPGLWLLIGKLKDSGEIAVQSIRFRSSVYTPAEARAWVKKHFGRSGKFHAAKKSR